MFICADCKKPTPPGVPQRKFVTETRQTAPDIGFGRTETVKEVGLCPPCAKQRGVPVSKEDCNQMFVFTHQRHIRAEEKRA